MRATYDPSFEPPAPVITLRIAAPGGEAATLLRALIDTGADCTLVPESVADILDLPAVDRIILEGIGGRAGVLTVYAASVELPGLRFIAPVVAHGTEALIGRDLLGRLLLRLDGPAGQLTVTSPRRRSRR